MRGGDSICCEGHLMNMERAVVLCIYVCIFFSCCFFYSEAGVSLTVKNGYLLPNNKFVGTYTSQLQKNVLNSV